MKEEELIARVRANRTTAFHITGGAVDMAKIDAKQVVENHPSEWSFSPWPAQRQPAGAVAFRTKAA